MSMDADEDLLDTPAERETPSSALAPEFDPRRYLGKLEGCGLSEAQAEEYLGMLWVIMARFVELGFECDVCALLLHEDKSTSAPESPGVLLENSNNTKTGSAHAGGGARARDQ